MRSRRLAGTIAEVRCAHLFICANMPARALRAAVSFNHVMTCDAVSCALCLASHAKGGANSLRHLSFLLLSSRKPPDQFMCDDGIVWL